MEIKWIEDFIALAQHQSFSRAAELRNVTQSGLSRRIQALEQWIGAELIDRSTYPPTLTPAGRLFLEAAEDIVGKLFDTRAIIRSEQRMPGTGLQIAAGHALSVGFVPDWLQSLQSRFSGLRVRIVPTNVHDSILMLVNGNCELMFAYHHPQLPLHLDPSKYEHLTVGVDVLMPVCKPNERGNPIYRLSTAGTRALPMISYTETSYFGRCLAFLLKRMKVPPKLESHYESDMAELVKKMAVAGEGIAWLPRSAVAAELAEGQLVQAGIADCCLELELRVYRDASARHPLVATLWQGLAESSAKA